MPDFARLDRLDAMQRQPMGSIATSMKPPSPVASQYKRQAAMYGQALRTLSRAARRGGNGRGEKGQRQAAMAAEAGMKAIELRDKANANGFSPGGIQRYEDVQGNIASRERDYTEGAQDLESKMRLERDYSNSVLSRGRVNPNATERAGRGSSISEGESEGGSPDLFQEVDTPEGKVKILTRWGFLAKLNRQRMAEGKDPISVGGRNPQVLEEGSPPPLQNSESEQGPPNLLDPKSESTSTRTSAALDMLEGSNSLAQGGIGQLNRGREAARSLGVDDPDSILSGDRNLKYRQTLDMALGQAKTPEEIAALKERGTKFGISPRAFDRRAKWWDSNR